MLKEQGNRGASRAGDFEARRNTEALPLARR